MTNLNPADWTMVEDLIARAGTRMPDYAEDAIAATAQVRQRPAWTFAGRWVPAGWMPVGLRWGLAAALLVLGLLAGLLWAGSQPPERDPLAANGLIAVSVCDASLGGIARAVVDPADGRVVFPADRTSAGSVIGFSPDGTRLAYLVGSPRAAGDALCEPPDVSRLYVSDPDGSAAVQLTGDLMRVTDASWSPDGRQIAVSFSSDASRRTIAIVATDGSGMRVLDLGGPASVATWEPGGRRILFWGLRDAHQAIYTVSVDDPTDIRGVVGLDVVASASGVQAEAAWSPDGRWIAYVRRTTSNSSETSLHVVAIDGSGDMVLPVTSHEGLPMRPRWSPDGTRILAKAWMQLVVASVDGTAVREIGPPPADENIGITDFAWSPDGRMVAAGPHYTVVPYADGSIGFDDPRIVLIDVARNTWRTLDPGADMPVQLAGGAALAWQATAP